MAKQQKPKQENFKTRAIAVERLRNPHTAHNKTRKNATRLSRLRRAVERRLSNDVCIPGTNTRAKPKDRSEAIVRRVEQAARIATKRETRKRLRAMTPKQREQARENGRKQFHPRREQA